MAELIINKFNMKAHPEGGYYVETFRSDLSVKIIENYNEIIRPASTAIYFLITPGNVSRLHRIKSDEVWHFYLGGPMTVIELSDDETGNFKSTILGSDISKGELLQYTVKRDTWFGSYINEGSEYSLVGCTVSPGFVFEDFELGSNQQLIQQFPKAKSVIDKLTVGLP